MIAINSQKGEVIDISFGGLAFLYTSDSPWPRQETEVGLLCGEDDFCLQLPVQTVADIPLPPYNGTSPAAQRRSSMLFGDLNTTQLLQLMAFIRDNTPEEEHPKAGGTA